MSKGSLLLGALICVLCTNAVAGWVCDGARPGIVAAEVDPVFVGYSNSTAFAADVRAAQTNDGYEADTTYMDDLASFTNAVRVAQTNMVEADPVFAATGALQVDLVAVSNKAAAAYGWGDYNRLYLNLIEPLVYDANGSALHFQVEWGGKPDFSSATGYCTTNSQANWYYFNGTSYAAFPTDGIAGTAYGTNGLASVIFHPTNVLTGPAYIRARSFDGVDWSDYRAAYGVGTVRLGN